MSDTSPVVDQWQESVRVLRRECGDDIAVVLIGSAARGVSTEESDVDLLVIGKNRPVISTVFSGYHIQATSEWEFLRNLRNGEDFEAWCVRLGRPLYDAGLWSKIVGMPEAATWPKWQTKVIHGARRLFLARGLLEVGDRSAATEETLYVLGHVARGLLLKSGVFPLSRPELAGQIRGAGYPHLADIHERLRGPVDVPNGLLAAAQRYSKKLLSRLDRETYADSAAEYRARKKEKLRRIASRPS